MYHIKFRGGREPIVVSDERGKKIQADFISGTLPKVLELDGSSFVSNLINAVERVGVDRAVTKYSHNQLMDLRKERAQFPQQRIEGRLLSPSDQLLISKNVVAYRDGTFVVTDGMGMAYLSDMLAALERYEYGVAMAAEKAEGSS